MGQYTLLDVSGSAVAPQMPVSVSLSLFLGSRGVRLRACNHHVARFGCATAAGTMCMASGGLSRLRHRTHRQVTRATNSSEFGSARRRVTDSLLVFNAVMFAAQLITKQGLTVWGAKHNASIAKGELWRLITPAFLHGNVVHIVLNSAALNSLGPLVETVSGRGRFLTVYTVAAVAGVTASYLGSPNVSLGSSGAVFGIGGALAVFFYRHREFFGRNSDAVLKNLGQNLAMNMIYGLVAPNIDNWAHMGGLLGGALAAYLLGPKIVQSRPPGSKQPVYSDRPPIGLFATHVKPGGSFAGS